MPLYEKNNYPIEEYDQHKNPLKVTIHNTHIETDEAFYDLTEKFNQIKLINCTSPARLMSHVDIEIMDSQLNVFDIEPKDLDIPAKQRNEVIITNSKIREFKSREDTIAWVADNSEFHIAKIHGTITFAAGSRADGVEVFRTGIAYVKDGVRIDTLDVYGTVYLDNCSIGKCIVYPGGRLIKRSNATIDIMRASYIQGRNPYTEHHQIRQNKELIGEDYICG